MIDQTRYKPGQFGWKSPLEDRMAKFDRLNAFIHQNGGWTTSVPGDSIIQFDALEGSDLPESLRNAGYNVVEIGVGQRIIPNAIIRQMTLTSSGAFEEAVEGSTKPIASVVTHSGITPVRRWQFGII